MIDKTTDIAKHGTPHSVSIATHAMATRFELVLFGDNKVALRSAGEEAVREINRIGQRFNFHDPASELSKVNRDAATKPVKVAGDLFELLLLCEKLHQETGGYFDPTVGPLMKLWGFAPSKSSIPTSTEISKALTITGWHHVKLDSAHNSVQFAVPGVAIDLGGIAKGWALDEAAYLLKEAGVTSGLIHGGTSSVRSIGLAADHLPWRIGIEDPYAIMPIGHAQPAWFKTVEIIHGGLSVSAINGKKIQVDQIEYGHIVDPRTGSAQSGPLVSIATAPQAANADGWSTAVLARNRHLGSFSPQDDVEAFCFEKQEQRWEIIQSIK